MSTPKQVPLLNRVLCFVILLVIGLLLPIQPAFAQAQTPGIEAFAKKLPPADLKNQLIAPNEEPTGRPRFLPTITANLLQDPSFESSFLTDYYWAQYSTNHWTPVCETAYCGDGAGTAGPRTGSVWGWFGGVYFGNPGVVSPEVDYVYQYVPFPSCGAKLQFYLWIGYAQQGSGTN